MPAVNTYLNFNGQTEEAFNFYKSVFGGEFMFIQRMKETPGGEKLPETEKERIMHVALPIGNGNILMGSDILESHGHKLREGNNFYISVMTDSEAEADELFGKLSSGGQVSMPLAKMFWGDYFGSFTDKFGIQWMISYHYEQQS